MFVQPVKVYNSNAKPSFQMNPAINKTKELSFHVVQEPAGTVEELKETFGDKLVKRFLTLGFIKKVDGNPQNYQLTKSGLENAKFFDFREPTEEQKKLGPFCTSLGF